MKILLAEDTSDLNHALCVLLTRENYDVTSALDGLEAKNAILRDSFDAVILDIMMPKMNGLEVLSEMRSRGITTPVLMLTAKSEIDDRVAGLDAGADDYLTKPFAMKELLARVRALTRRAEGFSEDTLKYEDLELKAGSNELTCENSIRLSSREYELMRRLILNAGKPLTGRWLLEQIWKNDTDASEDTVWLYISYLRRKLEAVSSHVVIAGEKGGSFQLN